jgi:hypothetical protein
VERKRENDDDGDASGVSPSAQPPVLMPVEGVNYARFRRLPGGVDYVALTLVCPSPPTSDLLLTARQKHLSADFGQLPAHTIRATLHAHGTPYAPATRSPPHPVEPTWTPCAARAGSAGSTKSGVGSFKLELARISIVLLGEEHLMSTLSSYNQQHEHPRERASAPARVRAHARGVMDPEPQDFRPGPAIKTPD